MKIKEIDNDKLIDFLYKRHIYPFCWSLGGYAKYIYDQELKQALEDFDIQQTFYWWRKK